MTATASSIAAQLDMNAGAAGDAVWLTSPDTGATVTWAAARGAAREIACQLDALDVLSANADPVVRIGRE